MELLNKYRAFVIFTKYHNIDQQSIVKAAEYFELKYCEKGSYLFHEGDKSNYFYGIMSGRISMRHNIEVVNKEKKEKKEEKKTVKIKKLNIKNGIKNFKKTIATINEGNKGKKKSVKQNLLKVIKEEEIEEEKDKRTIIEEELFTKGDGYCFGEFGLMYNIPRTSSCYCTDSTYFFALNEEHFKNTLMKALTKSEVDKRIFLRENLFPFDSLTPENLDALYKNIIPLQYTNNAVIYKEREKAESIYIVYMNQFILEKQFMSKNFQTYQNYNILKIEKGGVIGLEAIYDENAKYNFSLKTNCRGELAVIYTLKVERIPEVVKRQMKKYFTTYYQTFKKTVDKFYEQKVHLDSKKINNTITKNIFQTMSENEKCQSAINEYFKKVELSSSTIHNDSNELRNVKIVNRLNIRNAILLKGKGQKLSIKNSNRLSPEKSCQTSRTFRQRQSYICNENKSNNKSFNFLPKMKLTIDHSNSNTKKQSANISVGSIKVSEETKKNTIQKNHSCCDLTKKLYKKYSQISQYAYDSGRYNIPLVSKILDL